MTLIFNEASNNGSEKDRVDLRMFFYVAFKPALGFCLIVL